ncbi:MAG: DUF2202 domain-containing protein [Halobacteriaceae archaeon]
MDRRNFLGATTALVLGAATAGCLGTEDTPDAPIFVDGQNGASSVDTDALRNRLDSYTPVDLSTTEREDIFYMREEEKVARDVYLALADEWGLTTHDRISDSEQTHMDAMLQLVETYDLEDPATGVIGTFTNEDLQAFHDDLVEWGRSSVIASLKVGCRIEERDMRDIQLRVDRTDEEPVTLVYENLLKGSRNHLRAYYRRLTRYDGEYDPIYISQSEFDAIVDSDWETGPA